MFYFAYFLDQNLNVNLDEAGNLNYISISVVKASRTFMKEMEDLEVRYFGRVHSQAEISDRTIDFSNKAPLDIKQLKTDAPLAQ